MIRLFAILFAVQCASATVNFACTYSMNNWIIIGNVYNCNPRVTLSGQTRNVVRVSGSHQSGKRNQDVKALDIFNQAITFFPENINSFFPNLELINFNTCPIRSFTKDDLKPFPNLKVLAMVSGQLTTINGDVFANSPELRLVNFNGNKITNVGPGIFQRSPKLIYARFVGSLCINSEAVNSATAVATIARELIFKCPPSIEMTEDIILAGTKLPKAVDNRVDPKIAALDTRVKRVEDETKALTNNYLTVSNKVQRFEETIAVLSSKQNNLDLEIEVLSGKHATLERKMLQLEEEYKILTNNHEIAVARIQKLEEDNQQAQERIDAHDRLFFDLCAIYAICL